MTAFRDPMQAEKSYKPKNIPFSRSVETLPASHYFSFAALLIATLQGLMPWQLGQPHNAIRTVGSFF